MRSPYATGVLVIRRLRFLAEHLPEPHNPRPVGRGTPIANSCLVSLQVPRSGCRWRDLDRPGSRLGLIDRWSFIPGMRSSIVVTWSCHTRRVGGRRIVAAGDIRSPDSRLPPWLTADRSGRYRHPVLLEDRPVDEIRTER